MFINKYCFYSAFSVTSAATTTPDVDEVPDSGSSRSPEPIQLEEEGQEPEQGAKKGKGKRKADGAPKQAWSLPEETEMNLVEWLQGHSYLWLRSTRDYHKKKAAWELKAQEIGVSYKHLQNWWKNIKDWYVKLSKKTSGQATKLLTDRDKWVLKNIAFYKSKYMSLHLFQKFVNCNEMVKYRNIIVYILDNFPLMCIFF